MAGLALIAVGIAVTALLGDSEKEEEVVEEEAAQGSAGGGDDDDVSDLPDMEPNPSAASPSPGGGPGGGGSPGPRFIRVQVPPDAQAGQRLALRLPEGQTIAFVVPEGGAGKELTLQVPSAAAAAGATGGPGGPGGAEGAGGESPQREAAKLFQMGLELAKRGMLPYAIESMEKGLALAEEAFGPTHECVEIFLAQLGAVNKARPANFTRRAGGGFLLCLYSRAAPPTCFLLFDHWVKWGH